MAENVYGDFPSHFHLLHMLAGKLTATLEEKVRPSVKPLSSIWCRGVRDSPGLTLLVRRVGLWGDYGGGKGEGRWCGPFSVAVIAAGTNDTMISYDVTGDPFCCKV